MVSTAHSSDNDSTNNNMEVIFVGQSSSFNNNYAPIKTHAVVDNEFNSCKILQRKLELKVERAKRNFGQYRAGTIERTQVRGKRLHCYRSPQIDSILYTFCSWRKRIV